ncbi:MAG: hypothetical protein U0796_22185 [Gemmatales bacterium]
MKKKRKRIVPLADLVAVPNAEELAIDERRRLVAEYYIKGWSSARIGRALSVHPGTIKRDINAIHDEWRMGLGSQEILQMRAEEYARLRNSIQQLEEAYERSCQPGKVTRVKRNAPGDQPRTTVITWNRVGDYRLRAEIRKCLDWQCELMGLYR